MPPSVVTFDPGRLHGSVAVPGDKSISHRALIAGARCAEPLRIANLNPGRDVRATLEALEALGVRIDADGLEVRVFGPGLRPPRAVLECMNSGSTARMLLGACAGANLRARFDGDASLRRRPMEPVAAQLRAFGARIDTTQGRLPLALHGTPRVETRRFILLAPSAQVKSALLFAALFGGVAIRVDGDRGSRDHTERLLRYLGAEVEWDQRSVSLGGGALQPHPVAVAGDFSAAAFFITAAAITPGSAIVIPGVGVNSTRTGLIDVLRAMGAAIELRSERESCGEPVADIAVEHRPLVATTVSTDLALRAVDELLAGCGGRGLRRRNDGNFRDRGVANQGIGSRRRDRTAPYRSRNREFDRRPDVTNCRRSAGGTRWLGVDRRGSPGRNGGGGAGLRRRAAGRDGSRERGRELPGVCSRAGEATLPLGGRLGGLRVARSGRRS